MSRKLSFQKLLCPRPTDALEVVVTMLKWPVMSVVKISLKRQLSDCTYVQLFSNAMLLLLLLQGSWSSKGASSATPAASPVSHHSHNSIFTFVALWSTTILSFLLKTLLRHLTNISRLCVFHNILGNILCI